LRDKDGEIMNDINVFLTTVSDINKKYQAIYRTTGSNYNIFKIAGIVTKETAICKVIADLLNPKGSHYKGDIYLRLFRDKVLPSDLQDFNIERAIVYIEYSTDESRRIDIVIESSNVFLPIEVKIHASDQKRQVADYWDYSQKRNKQNIPVLYLTINGDPPGEDSVPPEDKDKYRCISFKKDILCWLNACLESPETQQTMPIKEVMTQLIVAIKSFCGMPEDGIMEKEIFDLIVRSKENYQTAQIVVKSFSNIENKIQQIFFEKLKNHFPDSTYKSNYYHIRVKKKLSYSLHLNWKEIQIYSDKEIDVDKINQISKLMNGAPPVSKEKWNGWIDHNRELKTIWYSNDIPRGFVLDPLEIGDSEDGFFLYRLYCEKSNVVIDKIKEINEELERILF
jgi:hypothetical protein